MLGYGVVFCISFLMFKCNCDTNSQMKVGIRVLHGTVPLEESNVGQLQQFGFSGSIYLHIFAGAHGKKECADEKLTECLIDW